MQPRVSRPASVGRASPAQLYANHSPDQSTDGGCDGTQPRFGNPNRSPAQDNRALQDTARPPPSRGHTSRPGVASTGLRYAPTENSPGLLPCPTRLPLPEHRPSGPIRRAPLRMTRWCCPDRSQAASPHSREPVRTSSSAIDTFLAIETRSIPT